MLATEFARNAQVFEARSDRSSAWPHSFSQLISKVFDELATDRSWSALKDANLKMMSTIQPSKSAAIVVAAKNEGVDFLEWLAHHRAVGFEHIFVYTNNNSDGSDKLYELLSQHGLITYIQNQTGVLASPQVKAYEHSLHFLQQIRDYEWVAYLDMDELLTPSKLYDYSIRNLLAELKRRYPVDTPGAVCFNWDWYGCDGQVLREPGLIQDRFNQSTPHPLVKSIVRLSEVKSMIGIHMAEMFSSYAVNSAFEPVDLSKCTIIPPNFHGGKLNHYYHKSFEEFAVKRDRGEGSSAGGLTAKELGTFFEWDFKSEDETFNPVPDILRQRVQIELELLLLIEGIKKIQGDIEHQFQILSLNANGTDILDSHEKLNAELKPNDWHLRFRPGNSPDGCKL